jgi:hypothetical protein
LRRCWPEYEKAISASELRKRINFQSVIGACEVEEELCSFLRRIGFF